jgi:hypothetical protein
MSEKESCISTSEPDWAKVPSSFSFAEAGFLPYGTIQQSYSRLLGKVLTLMDACVADPRQNKACKDLIRAEFNGQANQLRNMVGDPNAVEPEMKLQPQFDELGRPSPPF